MCVHTHAHTQTHTEKSKLSTRKCTQIIFLEGFNEHRMFMNTICSDSQRVEGSDCTTATPPSQRQRNPVFLEGNSTVVPRQLCGLRLPSDKHAAVPNNTKGTDKTGTCGTLKKGLLLAALTRRFVLRFCKGNVRR